MKRILVGGLVAALSAAPAFAISNDKLVELRTKAETGNGIAQYNLGLVYADPQEPIANIVEAYVWFSLAADNGAPGKALMIVTNQMTPEQLSDGKKLLEQRRADLAAHRPIAAAATTLKTPEPAASPITPAAPVISEQEVSSLRTELKKSSDALAAATKENQQIKADLEKANQTAIDKIKGERDELASKVASYTNEISSMRATAANFEGERNALKQQISEAQKKSQDASTAAADLAATAAKLKAAESELAKAEAGISELTSTKQTLASLNDQLQSLKGENQRLENLAKQTQTDSEQKEAASEKALNEINGELLKAQAKLADASAKANAATPISAELATLRQSNGDLSAQVQKLSAERDQALAQVAQASATAQQQIDALAAQLKEAEATAAKVSAENAGLTQQLATLRSAPPKADPETQAQLAKLAAELQSAQATAQAEKEDLAAKLKAAEDANAQAAVEKASLTQQLAALKAAAAAPKEDADAKAKIAQLAADIEAIQRNAADEKDALTEQLKTTEKQLAEANGQRQQLEQKLQAGSKTAKKDAAAQAKIDELKAQLESAHSSVADLETARGEIANLQSKLRATEEALAAAKAAPAVVAAEPSGHPAAPENSGADLQKELSETQMKLDASLRSYQLQQSEIDHLKEALANIDNERAQLAERLKNASEDAASAASRAAANNDAVAQLSGVREQLRQTQNQLASVAYENAELKHRLAFVTPIPGAATPPPSANGVAPLRPAAVSEKAPAAAQPVAQAPARMHTVAAGETLSTIAKRYYGSASRWPEILEANKGTLRDPAALRVGMKIKIP